MMKMKKRTSIVPWELSQVQFCLFIESFIESFELTDDFGINLRGKINSIRRGIYDHSVTYSQMLKYGQGNAKQEKGVKQQESYLLQEIFDFSNFSLQYLATSKLIEGNLFSLLTMLKKAFPGQEAISKIFEILKLGLNFKS